jgi:hypothetical protein
MTLPSALSWVVTQRAEALPAGRFTDDLIHSFGVDGELFGTLLLYRYAG